MHIICYVYFNYNMYVHTIQNLLFLTDILFIRHERAVHAHMSITEIQFKVYSVQKPCIKGSLVSKLV